MKIKLTIEEIVSDFYSLAETEGFISGLAECGEICEKDKKYYHNKMIELCEKYIPNYKKHVDFLYKDNKTTEDEKGLILSTMLYDNFKEMFYQLV